MVEPRSVPLLSDDLSFLTCSESFSYLNPPQMLGSMWMGLGKSKQVNGRKLHDGLDEREPPDRSRVREIFRLGRVFNHALTVSKRHFQERQKRKSKQCISNLKLLKLTDGHSFQPPQVLDVAYDARSASLHQTSEL